MRRPHARVAECLLTVKARAGIRLRAQRRRRRAATRPFARRRIDHPAARALHPPTDRPVATGGSSRKRRVDAVDQPVAVGSDDS